MRIDEYGHGRSYRTTPFHWISGGIIAATLIGEIIVGLRLFGIW